MASYNILWLDDYFATTSKDDTNENYRTAVNGFLRDVRRVEESGIHVKGVSTYFEFAEEFKRNFGLYHGVVFDLRGMAMSFGQEAESEVVAEAINLVKSTKSIPMYIYSNNIDQIEFKITIRGIVEGGRAFDKGLLVGNLIHKMHSDFDSFYHYYAGHEECLNLYNEGFLAIHTKALMDDLLKNFNDLSHASKPYNNMRQILENLTRTLCVIKLIDLDPDSSSFNQRVRMLAEFCHPQKDANNNPIPGTLDFNNPIVSYSDMNKETKILLRFLALMTNKDSHFDPYYSANDYGSDFNLSVLKATYHAFFAVMNWYYRFMHNRTVQNINSVNID